MAWYCFRLNDLCLCISPQKINKLNIDYAFKSIQSGFPVSGKERRDDYICYEFMRIQMFYVTCGHKFTYICIDTKKYDIDALTDLNLNNLHTIRTTSQMYTCCLSQYDCVVWETDQISKLYSTIFISNLNSNHNHQIPHSLKN